VTGLERYQSQRRRAVASAHTVLAAAFLATSLVVACLAVLAQDRSAATDKDAIFARKTLMNVMCDKLMEIENMIASGRIDLDRVRAHGDAISVMLLAFPHLFPPSSNQWKPNADRDPVADTFASPDLWIAFPDFYRQAAAASKSAHAMGRADTIDDVKMHARELRIVCDSCHALYLEDP
jgi:cytochrome c556